MGITFELIFAAMTAAQPAIKPKTYIMPEVAKSETTLCAGVIKKKINCPKSLQGTTEGTNV